MPRTEEVMTLVNLMELLDRSVAYTSKRVSLRFVLWLFGVPVGLFVFMALFIKSDLFAGSIGAGFVVLLVVFGLGVYFLPTIKAYQDKKRNKEAILAVNLFLGWTLVGWVVALAWAFAKDAASPVVAALPSTLCTSCGKYSHGGATFCGQCGKQLA
jgi:hypothetical protein